jgi:hypothetical protein
MNFPNFGLINKVSQPVLNDGLPNILYHNTQGYNEPDYTNFIQNIPSENENKKMLKFNNLLSELTDNSSKRNIQNPSSINSLFNGGYNRLQSYPTKNIPQQAYSLNSTTGYSPIRDNIQKENFLFYPPPPATTIQNNVFIFVIVLLLLFIFFKVINIQNELNYTLRDLQRRNDFNKNN